MERTRLELIGSVADRLHITIRTIRFYEEMGLIALKRTATGARHLDATDVERLNYILTMQRFGFTLKEIKLLLRRQTDNAVPKLTLEQAAAQLELLQRQRDGLTARIEELRAHAVMLEGRKT